MRVLKHRWIVVALALAAASAFALSVQGGRWWLIGDVELGPFGSHSPFRGAGSLSWAGGGVRWQRFGMATGAAGLIATLVLVAMAGGLAANRIPRLAARTALVAIATAALVGLGFVAMRPDGFAFVAGRGLALFAAAVVAGTCAAIAVLRVRA
jgi:hypothetical protein